MTEREFKLNPESTKTARRKGEFRGTVHGHNITTDELTSAFPGIKPVEFHKVEARYNYKRVKINKSKKFVS